MLGQIELGQVGRINLNGYACLSCGDNWPGRLPPAGRNDYWIGEGAGQLRRVAVVRLFASDGGCSFGRVCPELARGLVFRQVELVLDFLLAPHQRGQSFVVLEWRVR